MNTRKIVLNTLVYLDQLQNQVPQSILIKKISDLKVGSAEIRREFIRDFNQELLDIRHQAAVYPMTLFYSVPDTLFDNGALKEEKLKQYFKEAGQMGCHNVKMVIGQYITLKKEDGQKIQALCEDYEIRLTIENDQTLENGRSKKILEFLNEAKNFNLPLSMTFDIGNFYWVEEDPVETAKLLAPFVSYIHIKDVKKNGTLQTALLNQGIAPIKEVLSILPASVPVALEYPCPEEFLKEELEKLLFFL